MSESEDVDDLKEAMVDAKEIVEDGEFDGYTFDGGSIADLALALYHGRRSNFDADDVFESLPFVDSDDDESRFKVGDD